MRNVRNNISKKGFKISQKNKIASLYTSDVGKFYIQ